jgi:hypothetical protein
MFGDDRPGADHHERSGAENVMGAMIRGNDCCKSIL